MGISLLWLMAILIGSIVGSSFLVTYLVASKKIRLPLEREAYFKFNWIMEWGEVILAIVIFGPIVILFNLEGSDLSSREQFFMIGFICLSLIAALKVLRFVCPHCGKLLGAPIGRLRDAWARLNSGECPFCKFSFRLSNPGESKTHE